eukprot:9876507-Prorocentrum_lima.AAC.1
MVKITTDLRALQQDFTMTKDNMASELTVLEETIPNTKEVEARLMNTDGSLLGIDNSMEGLE